MFKKIILSSLILSLVFLGTFFIGNNTSAEELKVENIFSDIKADYKYLHELQVLYDKGMIKPDENGKFNPQALLKRDEFVGILMELTCKECIQPNTSHNLISQFENTKPFFDINKENKYFYCIAEANDKKFVTGYHKSDTCSDGTVKEGEKPFCANNTIVLEEAIAVIMRASGILTTSEAEEIRQDIYNGKITDSISDDVSPKIEGNVYSFYGDLRKALNYQVKDIDKDGNEKIYTLIEKKSNKIRPKKTVSKEEFLRIAYVTLKANTCSNKVGENNIALKMKIFDKECSGNDKGCDLSDLEANDNIYDFGNEVFTTCEEGVENPEGYIRRFHNYDSGKQIIKYGEYIDNYDGLSVGKWQVFLRVIDKCLNTAEVHNTINIGEGSDLKVSIDADPIYGKGPLLVDFEGIASGCEGSYSYKWDFGDGNEGFGKNIQNIFKEEGLYETLLTVTCSNGKTATATVLIQVIGEDCSIDTDNDGVNNCDDLCSLVIGDIRNKGCPILERECDCREGYICTSDTNVCLPKKLENSCEYTGGDVLFGNIVCNQCPCNYSLDFISTLRKCDIIFPAITSPDFSEIYGKGELFQIK